MTSTLSGVPSPKTKEVMVILTAIQGIGREQIMKVMPAENSGHREALSRRQDSTVVFEGRRPRSRSFS
jgi:hypothetical protein